MSDHSKALKRAEEVERIGGDGIFNTWFDYAQYLEQLRTLASQLAKDARELVAENERLRVESQIGAMRITRVLADWFGDQGLPVDEQLRLVDSLIARINGDLARDYRVDPD